LDRRIGGRYRPGADRINDDTTTATFEPIGWPFLEVHANHLSTGVNFTGTPVRFEIIQCLAMNIFLAPLWIAGLVAPFFWAPLKPARFLAVGLVGATLLVFLGHGKDYYLFPVYPSLFAAGAVVIAKIKPMIRTVWVTAALIVSLILAPVVLPILDPPTLAGYLAWTHLSPPPSEAAAGVMRSESVFFVGCSRV
jgi:hypothetical protein